LLVETYFLEGELDTAHADRLRTNVIHIGRADLTNPAGSCLADATYIGREAQPLLHASKVICVLTPRIDTGFAGLRLQSQALATLGALTLRQWRQTINGGWPALSASAYCSLP